MRPKRTELFRFLDSDRNGKISYHDIKNIIVAADKASGNENDDVEEASHRHFIYLEPDVLTEN
jgi:Ca2+-binding EF-hand superfamily protein